MFRKVLLFLALGLALTGCIEFDRQTVSYQHDPASDTLLVHQTYHGIYGADDLTSLTDGERDQLASVMKGQRTFFFANWIFELNREAFQQGLAEAADPKFNSLEEAHRRAQTNLLTLLIANVRVENGKFFLDDQGRPCGTQRVTIRNVRQLLAAGNALMRKALEVEMKGKETAAERELINAALARTEPFFSLTGQQIRFRFPLAKADFDKLGDNEEKLQRLLQEFVRLGGAMTHQAGEIQLRFGRTDAQSETVTLPMAGKESYRANALPHLRDTYGFAKDFDARKDREGFLRAKADK